MGPLPINFNWVGRLVWFAVAVLMALTGAIAGATVAIPFAYWFHNFDLLRAPSVVGAVLFLTLLMICAMLPRLRRGR
jgi:hypothetical protein